MRNGAAFELGRIDTIAVIATFVALDAWVAYPGRRSCTGRKRPSGDPAVEAGRASEARH
jgi:hypothetical protein